jgi:hypothetical protein
MLVTHPITERINGGAQLRLGRVGQKFILRLSQAFLMECRESRHQRGGASLRHLLRFRRVRGYASIMTLTCIEAH